MNEDTWSECGETQRASWLAEVMLREIFRRGCAPGVRVWLKVTEVGWVELSDDAKEMSVLLRYEACELRLRTSERLRYVPVSEVVEQRATLFTFPYYHVLRRSVVDAEGGLKKMMDDIEAGLDLEAMLRDSELGVTPPSSSAA